MWQKQPWTKFGGSCSAQSTWLAWPSPLAAKVRVRFLVMVWLEGGQGEVRGACPPPPPQHPKSPHLDPPPPPRIAPLGAPPPPTDPPGAPPPPPLYPPHSPSLNSPLRCPPPPPPPPPPKGASGQQLVGGLVGVQIPGVAPPP